MILNRGKKKADIIKELFDPAHYDPDTRPGEGLIPSKQKLPYQSCQLSNYILINGISFGTSTADENIGPSEIEVNLFVRDFQYIDIVKMEIGVQITFRFTIIIKSHCHRFLFLTVNSQHFFILSSKSRKGL